MEGALPSVVAGLVSVPVIAVPTSIGYGASFHGLAALLGMLNSCANGVSVVNIDNGFGARLHRQLDQPSAVRRTFSSEPRSQPTAPQSSALRERLGTGGRGRGRGFAPSASRLRRLQIRACFAS